MTALRPPTFEGAHDGLEVEKVDGRVGAPLQLGARRSRGTRGHGDLLSRPLEMLDELDGKLPGPGEDRDRACRSHQATELTGSRGVQMRAVLALADEVEDLVHERDASSNSPATSSTRSDNVPSSAKSRR